MRIAVVATGTNVGKTHVTCALLAHLRASSIPAIGYKPISSGGVEDAESLGRAGGDYVAPTYALERPVSPHLAAREEGVTIDLERIRERALELERRGGILVVETAGGLLSPLGEGTSNLDLVRVLEAKPFLVAPDRLGVLHDVSACMRTLAMPIVFSAPSSPDDSTGTNAEEIERLRLGKVIASFPRALWDEAPSLAQAERVWRFLASN
jgi:dethiobiotin synthetase